jgi:hypothetical protein
VRALSLSFTLRPLPPSPLTCATRPRYIHIQVLHEELEPIAPYILAGLPDPSSATGSGLVREVHAVTTLLRERLQAGVPLSDPSDSAAERACVFLCGLAVDASLSAALAGAMLRLSLRRGDDQVKMHDEPHATLPVALPDDASSEDPAACAKPHRDDVEDVAHDAPSCLELDGDDSDGALQQQQYLDDRAFLEGFMDVAEKACCAWRLSATLPTVRTVHMQITATLICEGDGCGYTRTHVESFRDLTLDLPSADDAMERQVQLQEEHVQLQEDTGKRQRQDRRASTSTPAGLMSDVDAAALEAADVVLPSSAALPSCDTATVTSVEPALQTVAASAAVCSAEAATACSEGETAVDMPHTRLAGTKRIAEQEVLMDTNDAFSANDDSNSVKQGGATFVESTVGAKANAVSKSVIDLCDDDDDNGSSTRMEHPPALHPPPLQTPQTRVGSSGSLYGATPASKSESVKTASTTSQRSSGLPAAPHYLLEHLLRTYFKPRQLELKCEKCGHATVHVSYALTALPRTLVVQVTRGRVVFVNCNDYKVVQLPRRRLMMRAPEEKNNACSYAICLLHSSNASISTLRRAYARSAWTVYNSLRSST